MEYIDYTGTLGGMCIFWTIYDWDAPQYQPTEEPRFIEKFGEDSSHRSYKFYGSEDQETFSRIRSEMLQTIPPPRRFVGKVRGPKGAEVQHSWHVGGMWTPNRERTVGELLGLRDTRRSEVRSAGGCTRRTPNH